MTCPCGNGASGRTQGRQPMKAEQPVAHPNTRDPHREPPHWRKPQHQGPPTGDPTPGTPTTGNLHTGNPYIGGNPNTRGPHTGEPTHWGAPTPGNHTGGTPRTATAPGAMRGREGPPWSLQRAGPPRLPRASVPWGRRICCFKPPARAGFGRGSPRPAGSEPAAPGFLRAQARCPGGFPSSLVV